MQTRLFPPGICVCLMLIAEFGLSGCLLTTAAQGQLASWSVSLRGLMRAQRRDLPLRATRH